MFVSPISRRLLAGLALGLFCMSGAAVSLAEDVQRKAEVQKWGLSAKSWIEAKSRDITNESPKLRRWYDWTVQMEQYFAQTTFANRQEAQAKIDKYHADVNRYSAAWNQQRGRILELQRELDNYERFLGLEKQHAGLDEIRKLKEAIDKAQSLRRGYWLEEERMGQPHLLADDFQGRILAQVRPVEMTPSDAPSVSVHYTNNPQGNVSVGSRYAVRAFFRNNTARAMLVKVQLVAENGDASVDPEVAAEFWIDPWQDSRKVEYFVTVNGAEPVVSMTREVVRWDGTPGYVDASTHLAPGYRLQVEWEGKWYDGQVLAVNADGTVKIHYVGYETSWDETLSRSRLYLP